MEIESGEENEEVKDEEKENTVENKKEDIELTEEEAEKIIVFINIFKFINFI